MRHRATPKFWKFHEQLPKEVQELATKNYELLKRDPRHPSVHFEKIGRMGSARGGVHYRAAAVEDRSGSGLGIIANTTGSLVVSNRL